MPRKGKNRKSNSDGKKTVAFIKISGTIGKCVNVDIECTA